MNEIILFEAIGVIAGLSVSIPSIPQIVRTIKTKNVQGLSIIMFFIRLIGAISYMLYGWYLGSISMVIFNAISVCCSTIMVILILIYKNNTTFKKKG